MRVLSMHWHKVIRSCRLDGPISFRQFRPNELAVMLKDKVGTRMPEFERKRRCIVEPCQMITGEAVTECVLRPVVYPRCLARLVE